MLSLLQPGAGEPASFAASPKWRSFPVPIIMHSKRVSNGETDSAYSRWLRRCLLLVRRHRPYLCVRPYVWRADQPVNHSHVCPFVHLIDHPATSYADQSRLIAVHWFEAKLRRKNIWTLLTADELRIRKSIDWQCPDWYDELTSWLELDKIKQQSGGEVRTTYLDLVL